MRTFTMLAAAAALASVMLTTGSDFSPADARVSLSLCISKEKACRRACLLGLNGKPLAQETFYELAQCQNKCWDNHAACVDVAMSPSAAKAEGSNPKPPKFTPVPKGLLDSNAGFATSTPAPTGTPVAPQQPAAPSLL